MLAPLLVLSLAAAGEPPADLNVRLDRLAAQLRADDAGARATAAQAIVALGDKGVALLGPMMDYYRTLA